MGSQEPDRARGTDGPEDRLGDAAADAGPDAGAPDATDAVAALTAENRRLRAELERLRDELRRIRRAQHETPPHYL